MPMSPRLLRPRATAALVAVDADARTYINAVRTADGGQYMEAGVQRAIDDFVIGCKADNIWTAIKASCILMGARTLSGALTPLVGTAPTNNGPFVSGDYNRETGLAGNGTSKSLNSNYAFASGNRNNAHLSVYRSVAEGTGTQGLVANTNLSGGAQIATTSTVRVYRANDSSATIADTSRHLGFIGVSRADASNQSYRYNGSSQSRAVASDVIIATNLLVFARPDSNPANFSDARISFYSIGESLDLALLDDRVSTLYTAIGAAI